MFKDFNRKWIISAINGGNRLLFCTLNTTIIRQMKGSSTSPPPFGWDDWYASVGGRSIHIAEVDAILHNIREYQYPKFKGDVNPIKTFFATNEERFYRVDVAFEFRVLIFSDIMKDSIDFGDMN